MNRASGLVDYHLHTEMCGHARGSLEDYANRAAALGLAQIGFSDHFPMLHIEDPRLAMGLEELPFYVDEVMALGPRFAPLEVRLGIEVDFIPEMLPRLKALLGGFSFDYVMGSVHYVDGWGFDDPRYIDGYEGRDIYALWSRYFELVGDAAECGLFDVLAHPDLIKKFEYRPEEDVSSLYAKCLDRVAAAGVALEVSTAGLRKPVGEIYPGERFLEMCRARDIAFTLGSDAHQPEEVGYRFEEAVDLLRRVGYENITTFKSRRPSLLRI
jgi:histidinol-phosphatase (PHP family)